MYSESIFLLFSYEINTKKKKINFPSWKILKSKILENELKKGDNKYTIELYKINYNKPFPFFMLKSYIDLEIDNYKLDLKTFQDEIFIFNEKKDLNVNCLSIEEEFNFYYDYIQKNTDISKNALNSLIKSIFRILQEDQNHSTLSLLLTIILINEDSRIIINKNNFEQILLLTSKKGDFSKFNEEKVCSKLNKKPFITYFIIYNILENKNKLRDLIKYEENKQLIFDCLKRYKKLFNNNIENFLDYSFLIEEANSIDKLYILFQYTKNLSEFIFLLNDKKEKIFKLIFEKDKEKEFMIENFFSLKEKRDNIFQKFNDSFYISLIRIKEYILLNYKEKYIYGFRNKPKSDFFIQIFLFNYMQSIFLYY